MRKKKECSDGEVFYKNFVCLVCFSHIIGNTDAHILLLIFPNNLMFHLHALSFYYVLHDI